MLSRNSNNISEELGPSHVGMSTRGDEQHLERLITHTGELGDWTLG